MPIYEFRCNQCGKNSEQLCPLQWEGKAKCIYCGSNDLKRMLSQFNSTGRSASSSCSGCRGKSCSTCK